MSDGPAGSEASPILATEAQLAAERRILNLVRDPRVRAVVAEVRETLLADPAAASETGLAGLDNALNLWLHSLAFSEVLADVTRPAFLWNVEDTPHAWFGHTFPGAAISGDTPDNIYMGCYIHGRHGYEVTGRFPPDRPSQVTMEILHAEPGNFALNTVGKGHVDLGNQTGMLRDDELRPDADGRFRLTLGPQATGGGFHVQTPDLPLLVNFRNTLSDWRQTPVPVSIRRTDDLPCRPALSDDDIISAIVRDLPGWVRQWTVAKESWLGPPPVNTLAGVLPRDGGWGFFTSGPYALAPDEALMIELDDGGAAYCSVHLVDRWYMTAPAGERLICRNNAQSARNPDGSITYVIARSDPGVANWLDASAQPLGSVILRWQNAPAGTDAARLTPRVAHVPLAELPRVLAAGCPRRTASERKDELAGREADFALRLTARAPR